MKDTEARRTAETNNILIHSVGRQLRDVEKRLDMLLVHLGLEIHRRTREVIREKGEGD